VCAQSVSVVNVNWNSNNSKWNVNVNRFDDDVRWGPGARVVSRNSPHFSSLIGRSFLF
jgi:hypothetical protein